MSKNNGTKQNRKSSLKEMGQMVPIGKMVNLGSSKVISIIQINRNQEKPGIKIKEKSSTTAEVNKNLLKKTVKRTIKNLLKKANSKIRKIMNRAMRKEIGNQKSNGKKSQRNDCYHY